MCKGRERRPWEDLNEILPKNTVFVAFAHLVVEKTDPEIQHRGC